jgi:glucose/arabinose dehydrogenase/PKD repeat protein
MFDRRTPAARALIGGVLVGALVLALLSLSVRGQSAAVIPPDFEDSLVASVATPTGLAFTPDGRLLIATQTGKLHVYQNGTLLASPALDLAARICTDIERGLLGVAVDPEFFTNRYIYLFYTFKKFDACPLNSATSPVNRASRFVLSDANVVDPAQELVLVDNIPAPNGNHNAGDVQFGKDGFLYIGTGDGGCDYAGGGCGGANDASRDQHALVGKILRVTSTGDVPTTNPFLGPDSARCSVLGRTDPGKTCQETFAWGLRNPFRLAFDPNASTTRFFINDVGQNLREEIDLGQSGADYGWNLREANCVTESTTDCGPPPPGLTNPIYSYDHADGCASITGGAFVPGGAWPPAYEGTYLFSDYECGKIFRLADSGGGTFIRTELVTGSGASSAVTMIFGPHGPGQALYYTTYAAGGQVRRLAYTGTANRAPTAIADATPTSGGVPLDVLFDATRSSDPDGGALEFEWDFGDGQPHVFASTISHSYASAGTYTAVLTVRDTLGSVGQASVRIDVGNSPPVPSIISPASGARFRVGQVITLQGSATDAEDPTIPDSSLSWTVTQHHNTHTHPFLAATPGNNITITAPAPEDLQAAMTSYLEIRLTATDSLGRTGVVTQEIHPQLVPVTFDTTPTGLRLTVNGTSITAPQTLVSWEAHRLDVDAPAQPGASGQSFIFASWSDGGPAQHSIVTPPAAAIYHATFTSVSQPSELVAAYAFDEGSGTVTADASNNANGGSVSGAAWVDGRFGKALSFDGVNDLVTVNDAASLDLTVAMTLEAWVNPRTGNGWRNVLLKERPGQLAYALYGTTDTTRASAEISTGANLDVQAAATLALNTWSHLAATYDGATLRLFVNGTQVNSRAVTGAIAVSGGPLRIGGNTVWGEYFAGLIDDVRIYSRALSQSEVQTDMNTPVGAPPAGPDFSLASTPGTGTVVQGSSTSYTASVGALNGFTGTVSFDVTGLPAGATPTFTPASVSGAGSSSLTVATTAATATGSYPLTITSSSGTLTHTAPVTLVVTAPPDFSLSATPGSRTVVRGSSASYTVSVSALNGFGGTVSFDVTGLPPDATPAFTPASVSGTGSSSLTVATTAATATGSYPLTITGTSGSLTHSAPVTLIITEPPPPSSGLVAAFGFNETSGTIAPDASGTGNDGTILNATRTTGKYGSALVFNGSNAWVTVADAASLDLTAGMTLEAWVYPRTSSGWRTVVLKERAGQQLSYALYGNTNTNRASVEISNGSNLDVRAPATLALNAWSHLAATYDGATLRLFVNGTQVGSRAVTGAMVVSGNPLRIGGNSVWGEYFNGYIDELRVYNRALSASEIATDMNTPIVP